jgi:hypothetical protein
MSSSRQARSTPQIFVTLVVALAALQGCSDDDARPDVGPAGDASARADASLPDAAARDAGSSDAGSSAEDASTTDAGGAVDERGFTLRVPQVRQVPCESRAGGCDAPTVAARDADLVCTLVDGARNQYLYAQVHVDRIDGVTNFFPQPVYVTDGVWISDGTRVISSGHTATYDYGGGHNNDSLTVDLGDVVYKYYHSSFGFGFRRCQEMDCLQSYAPGAATPTVDGCTRERTRPIVCVRVTDTGTVPPMRDTFMRCAGDGS